MAESLCSVAVVVSQQTAETLTTLNIAYQTNCRGMLGLQIHKGAGPSEIAWKNIRIRDLDIPIDETIRPSEKGSDDK